MNSYFTLEVNVHYVLLTPTCLCSVQRAVFCSAVSVWRTVFSMSITKYFLLRTTKDSVDDENERALTARKVTTAVMIADSSDGSGRKRRSATMTYDEDVRSKFEK